MFTNLNINSGAYTGTCSEGGGSNLRQDIEVLLSEFEALRHIL